MTVTVFGVRHHGPGSARSLARALDALQPDAVLVEGPPDAAALVELARHEQMRPPVALLVYATANPRRSAFYPFASFSPEWQALRYAHVHKAPFRFIDLPVTHWLAEDEPLPHGAELPEDGGGDDVAEADDLEGSAAEEHVVRTDPLAQLARAAGHDDPERWWEDVVEHRRDELASFEAIADAMTALREDAEPENQHDVRREAYMRQQIRAAQTDGFERIAVVCGAWHVPALIALPPRSHDQALLRGLPKTKVTATWVPWTYDRLALASGYGAGVISPGWYDHLFTTEEDVVVRWLTKTARLLRDEDFDFSSAHLLEAARTADTLSVLRGRPLPGLPEITDATRAVVGVGADAALALVHERLVVGLRLGEVPEDTPSVPLQADVVREQKRLRLTPKGGVQELDLDLRTNGGRDRSRLLHRLRLLGILWGEPSGASNARGTFHELWSLRWQPEFAVQLIEASVWGSTLVDAANAYVADAAEKADDLTTLTQLIEATLLADLADATARVMATFEGRAATSSDTLQLMEALPPLARIVRYGNVRGTDAETVAGVAAGLVTRVSVGLAGAVSSLDDEAAEEMSSQVVAVNGALGLLESEELTAEWEDALDAVASRSDVHGLVAGRSTRLLMDARRLDATEVGKRLSLALSPGTNPGIAAGWVEGFLSGSGIVLIHDQTLLALVDRWVTDVDEQMFVGVLPVLRRTFSTFTVAERRQIGERTRQETRHVEEAVADDDGEFDHDRVALVLPILTRILGVSDE